MEQTDIQQISQQLTQILNLVQETRNDLKLMKYSETGNTDDPLIPNRQVAEILDLKPKSLLKYRKKKILEAVIIQKRVFYRRSVVRKFIAEHLK
ncbi:helix-turn-helix domain-containing protein [Alistipes finegoldii]|uniref:helix-turn-helix domain-containing protein n=1 Tax=Alistipes finegoldii TaxID=214856 RepID=UPI00242D10FE|nr:helix-turn-helix domain-containing protein [Alistipes finegoldii]